MTSSRAPRLRVAALRVRSSDSLTVVVYDTNGRQLALKRVIPIGIDTVAWMAKGD